MNKAKISRISGWSRPTVRAIINGKILPTRKQADDLFIASGGEFVAKEIRKIKSGFVKRTKQGRYQARMPGKYIGVRDTEAEALLLLENYKKSLP